MPYTNTQKKKGARWDPSVVVDAIQRQTPVGSVSSTDASLDKNTTCVDASSCFSPVPSMGCVIVGHRLPRDVSIKNGPWMFLSPKPQRIIISRELCRDQRPARVVHGHSLKADNPNTVISIIDGDELQGRSPREIKRARSQGWMEWRKTGKVCWLKSGVMDAVFALGESKKRSTRWEYWY